MTPTQPPDLTIADRIRLLTETRQQILTAPAEQALAMILDQPQPAALVHSFPEEDLHFLVHDIGLGNALPLLSLASNRQWEYLLDTEAWNRDRLDYQQATAWLLLLLQADPDRLVKWCFDEKLDFLELYLFRNIEVRIRESDQAPSDFGNAFFTDDDTFYVRFVDYPVSTPQDEAVKARRNEMLGQLLRRISLFDHPRYQGLLMEATGVIPGETEEELFRLRNVRLGEKGFLPFHEAIGVYQPLLPDELKGCKKKVNRPQAPEDARFPVPQFAAAFLDGDNLFVRALKGINQAPVVQQLQLELASLCNQVISADQEIIRGRSQLKSVVSKVSAYLSIGLELTTRSSEKNLERQAAVVLQHHLLADIFRTGFAGALQLKWRATRWQTESWIRTQKIELTFWEEAWFGMLGGLLIDRPKFFDPSANADSSYRDFHTLAEIESTGRELDQVIALDGLFKKMGISLARVSRKRYLTYKNLLLTLWARACMKAPAIDQETERVSIGHVAFKKFYAALWTTHHSHRVIGNEKKTDFLQWAANASGFSPIDLSEALGKVFESLFNQIENELASVKVGNLDPHYVQLFLIDP